MHTSALHAAKSELLIERQRAVEFETLALPPKSVCSYLASPMCYKFQTTFQSSPRKAELEGRIEALRTEMKTFTEEALACERQKMGAERQHVLEVRSLCTIVSTDWSIGAAQVLP